MNLAIFSAGLIGLDAATTLRKKRHHVTLASHQPEILHDFVHAAGKLVVLNDYDQENLLPIITNNQALVIAPFVELSKETSLTSLEIGTALRLCSSKSSYSRYLVYVSSTIVYGDHRGLWVDEKSALRAKSEEAKNLIKAEKVFKSLEKNGWSVCILRIAELYGPEREFSKKLKLLTGPLPGSGLNYTNMIHRFDVAAAIEYCISHRLEGIYNLSDDEHPTREALYSQVTQKFQLPAVTWDPNYDGLISINKRVSNRKIKSAGFSLRYPKRIID